MTLLDEELPQQTDTWQCQSCGHKFNKPWPKDRAKFYASERPHICPKCKSYDAMPVGF